MRNYSHDMRELKTEQLKDWETDFEKIVTSNINTFIDHGNGQSYSVRAYVYHHGVNKYVQIKKFDDARKVYICRIKGEEKVGDIEGTIDEISD